jgi:hypothetical protein
MATNAQLADAQKFFGVIRGAIVTLQGLQPQVASAITKYNGLTAGQKTGLLALINLDQAEADSIISALTTINTNINSLPNVTPSF